VLVDVGAEPAEQRLEVAVGDVHGQVRTGVLNRLHELGRREGAERVGGEVAERTLRPVHVLQHAVRVRLGDHAEIRVHRLVPALRQFVDAHRAVDEAALQFEAEHDVQVVGHLVGLHANEGRLHPVDGAVERL
jgi:hypothetical protein